MLGRIRDECFADAVPIGALVEVGHELEPGRVVLPSLAHVPDTEIALRQVEVQRREQAPTATWHAPLRRALLGHDLTGL